MGKAGMTVGTIQEMKALILADELQSPFDMEISSILVRRIGTEQVTSVYHGHTSAASKQDSWSAILAGHYKLDI